MPHDLQRFLDAQDAPAGGGATVYERALAELRAALARFYGGAEDPATLARLDDPA
ncbi:MAG: hypothetical protein JF588_01715 [Caulobacterales bacterium]|nr:hypothetical protein [Caulobacterales bacterium]